MKKIILSLVIALSSIASFAGEGIVSSSALSSFDRDFSNAKEVKWTTGVDYYKASFIYNDQYVTAYYDEDGALLATTRNLSSLDLPINLQTNLRKDYKDYWISDVAEVSNTDGTQYYITLEKADSKITLKSSNSGKWKTYKKVTKA